MAVRGPKHNKNDMSPSAKAVVPSEVERGAVGEGGEGEGRPGSVTGSGGTSYAFLDVRLPERWEGWVGGGVRNRCVAGRSGQF